MNIQAYVLIRIYPNKINDVLSHVESLKGVKQVHGITGPYDGIAHIEAKDVKELSQLVLSEMQSPYGVRDTTTCLVVS